MQLKDQEINSLRSVQSEIAELKGKQLIMTLKNQMHTITADPKVAAEESKEEIIALKQQLSEKTNRILELTEKLQLVQETYQALEERMMSQPA